MADCWSCGHDRGTAPFCPACDKIQPVLPLLTHFEVLGLPRKFSIDARDVDRALRDLSRRVHPDRFGTRSSVERRLAVEQTARLNEAHRVLKEPTLRAEYLMALEGVDIGSEASRTRNHALLLDLIELQEEVETESSLDALADRRADIIARRDTLIAPVRTYFDDRQGARQDIVDALEEMRYLGRILEMISRKLERKTDRPTSERKLEG